MEPINKVRKRLVKGALALSILLGGCKASMIETPAPLTQPTDTAAGDANPRETLKKNLADVAQKESQEMQVTIGKLDPEAKKQMAALNRYFQDLDNASPKEKIYDNICFGQSLNQYLGIAYGKNAEKVINNAIQYQQDHPKLFFASHYNHSNLFYWPTIGIMDPHRPDPPLGETNYIDIPNNQIQNSVITLNVDPSGLNEYGTTALHETIHGTAQRDKDAANVTKANVDDYNKNIEADIDVLYPNASKQTIETAEYLGNYKELEVRLAIMKQANFVMTGEIASTPEQTVVMLKRFGFTVDKDITQEMFKQEGLAISDAAFKTEPLNQDVLNRFYSKCSDVKALKDDLDDCINEAPEKRDAKNMQSPDAYQFFLRAMIFKTPGVAEVTKYKAIPRSNITDKGQIDIQMG